LNEIAVLKRDISAMLHIHVSLNEEYLNDYQADGLIISTSTGSTAYALSVGGPILFPENPSIVLAPVAPHSLTVRTIVLSDRSVIDLRVESRSQNFLVALDGRSFPLPGNAQLRVVRADFPIQIVRRKSQSFVQTLRAKMMWGKDLRNT
jgi:NAD+ kinase